MTGSELQKVIHDLLFYDNWLVLRINQGTAETKAGNFIRFAHWSMIGHDHERPEGIADLLAFKSLNGTTGILLAIEVKGEGDRLRASQVDFLEAAAAAGAVPVIAKGVEDIEQYLSNRVEIQ